MKPDIDPVMALVVAGISMKIWLTDAVNFIEQLVENIHQVLEDIH
jgi:uncharacterized spore protein YtfJ